MEVEEAVPVLEGWRKNVGAAIVRPDAPVLASAPDVVDVLCWNLAIGRARLVELVEKVRSVAVQGSSTDAERPPLVLLVQEAYRADGSIPELAEDRQHGGRPSGSRHLRTDIVDFARSHRLSLCYAPSMRNGPDRSDRGNAVLSTVRLTGPFAFSLPLVRQRRVAVGAELAGLPGIAFVSAHLENRGTITHGPISALGFGATRAAQARALGERILVKESAGVVLGADLNTVRGARDPAYQGLLRSGFVEADRLGRWRHTFHGVLRLPLDHVLFHSAGGRIRRVEVRRLDENPRDLGSAVFGSDHHPLLARVYLGEPQHARADQ
jgi:endonuclease/exonuclease/phosphatase family metal-dependent hydrolase